MAKSCKELWCGLRELIRPPAVLTVLGPVSALIRLTCNNRVSPLAILSCYRRGNVDGLIQGWCFFPMKAQ